MSDVRPPARDPWSGKQDFAEWGELIAQRVQGAALGGVRKKLAYWWDPRARLLRRRRRARNISVSAGATTAIFGGGAFASWSPHLFGSPLGAVAEVLLDVTSIGFGGVAVLAGAAAVGAGLRYRRLRRIPLPDPSPEPVALPPPGSRAREPMQRLRGAEQSLHQALLQLAESDRDLVADVRRTAANAAAAMRRVAERLRVVEAGLPHTPESERAGLHSEVRRLRAELDEGVTGYGRLVAAAARAVAASGGTERSQGMQDATDRLAGLAAALEELTM